MALTRGRVKSLDASEGVTTPAGPAQGRRPAGFDHGVQAGDGPAHRDGWEAAAELDRELDIAPSGIRNWKRFADAGATAAVPDEVSGPVIPGIRMLQKTRSFEWVSASSSATPRSSSSSTTRIVRPPHGDRQRRRLRCRGPGRAGGRLPRADYPEQPTESVSARPLESISTRAPALVAPSSRPRPSEGTSVTAQREGAARSYGVVGAGSYRRPATTDTLAFAVDLV